MIEGEFHCVWIAPDGNLVDVTPHDAERSIIFVPDRSIRWRQRAPQNRRRLLRDTPGNRRILERILADYAAREEMYANPPPGVDFVEPPLIRARIFGGDDCPCGSGVKYKTCCRDLAARI